MVIRLEDKYKGYCLFSMRYLEMVKQNFAIHQNIIIMLLFTLMCIYTTIMNVVAINVFHQQMCNILTEPLNV